MAAVDPEKFETFIRRHHVMTLATVGVDGAPWVAHAFYAWMPDGNFGAGEGGEAGAGSAGSFVFMNNPSTRHGAEMSANARVAAGIALETRIVGRLQGVQIEGTVLRPEGDLLEKARKAYLKRFPYATVMEQPLWVLSPDRMKLTDNTLGFGKKLIWERGDEND